jgi:signal transduction histidine kinase
MPEPTGSPEAARPLAWRLAVAFVAVAVAAVALFTVLLILVEHHDLGTLGHRQEQGAIHSIQHATESAYARGEGWSGADLSAAFALAAAADAHIEVLDASGRVVASPLPGPEETVPVTVDGQNVGSVRIQFANGGLTPADRDLRADLRTATLVFAAIVVLGAFALALAVARRMTRPLEALARAVRAIEGGDRGVRVGAVGGGREIAALAASFDRMAANLDHQESLRHALVADVAHELRTPLAILQASTEAVIDGVSQPSYEMVSSMHQEVLRLGQRVEDLDALTAAETAGLHLARSRVDLASVAAEAATALAPRFEEAKVALSLELTGVEVEGDQARLFQVVSNLLANAAKFTRAGGTVRLSVGRDAEGGYVEVTDSGVGIDPDELTHVFERFWRGRAAAGREGSGVGLAIVAELARAHGGTVEVHSSPGHGSTFRVRLPLAAQQSERV